MKTPMEMAELYFDTDCPRDQSVEGQLTGLIEARDSEWRRLVEEAKAVTESVVAASGALQAERDRLKGELAQFDALSVRLAKELAEARRLMEPYRDYDKRWSNGNLAKFLAATPAEQVQGEGAKPRMCACHLEEKQVCDICQGVTGPLNDVDPVAELAKRVDAHEKRLDNLEECPCIDKRHRHHVQQEKSAPPPPEAAGPGHAFVGNDWHHCDICDLSWDDHPNALPPIPEGTR